MKNVVSETVKVSNLVKSYGDKTFALKNISFNINKGEIIGILGPNGAGKTTTLNILAGCLSFDSGEVFINGVDIIKNPSLSKIGLGYLPEHPPLHLKMNIYEYLKYICELRKIKNKEDQIAKVSALCQLGSNLNVIISNLSKGYRQRVGIAGALLGDPSLVILDEPTSGLDPAQIVEIRELIKSLSLNHTIILSTQILAEIHSLCDRLIILCGGEIIANGSEKEIVNKSFKEKIYHLKVSGSINKIKGALLPLLEKTKIEFSNNCDDGLTSFNVTVLKQEDLRLEVSQLLLQNKICIVDFYEKKANLEETFLELTYQNAAKKLNNKEEQL